MVSDQGITIHDQFLYTTSVILLKQAGLIRLTFFIGHLYLSGV